ncbi:MAG: DNA/RNA nuclease SfsA [Caldisericia bacterium]|nr:DNA/RNA nuclease SfsA [Caldisericia bacterium]
MESFSENRKIIKIDFDKKGIFIERINKFLGIFEVENLRIYAHIHDPGRLNKILFKGNEILLKKVEKNLKRKTDYDLMFGNFLNNYVLINSKIHNNIGENLIKNGFLENIHNIISIKKEVKIGNKRLDFLILDKEEGEIYIEVKGCTFLEDRYALFPDAPTKRGTLHLLKMCELLEMNKKVILIFLIFIPQAEYFSPNKYIDKDFYEKFLFCLNKGLKILPFKFIYNIQDKYLYLVDKLKIKPI